MASQPRRDRHCLMWAALKLHSIGRSGRLHEITQRRQARREGVDIPLVVSVDEQRLRDLVFGSPA